MAYFQGLSDALNAAPNAQPATAVAAATQNDPAQAAQVFQQAQEAQAQYQAQEENQGTHSGFLGSALHLAGVAAKDTGVSTVLGYLGKPLQEVQRDYRFLHEVYAKNGFFDGLTATVPVIAGGAVGGLFGGPEGVGLGAEAGAAVGRLGLGNTSFQGANQASATASVSPGRDLATAFSKIPGLGGLANTNTGTGRLLSGATDGAFDLVGDPLMEAGGLNRARKEGTLAEKAFASDNSAAGQWLKTVAPGKTIQDGASIDRAVSAYKSVDRAVSDIASLDPAQIVRQYPKLAPLAAPLGAAITKQGVIDVLKSAAENKGIGDVAARAQAAANVLGDAGVPMNSVTDVEDAFRTNAQVKQTAQHLAGLTTSEVADAYPQYAGLATELGRASTPDAVQDVVRQAASNAEITKLINSPGLVPSKSMLRIKAANLQARTIKTGGGTIDPETGELLSTPGNVAGLAGRAIKSFTQTVPFAVDPKTQEISTRMFSASAPDAGRVVHQIASLGMPQPQANFWTNKFITAGSNLGLKKSIYKQIVLESAKAFGLADDTDVVKNFADDLGDAVHGPFDGQQKYGHGAVGGDGVNQVPVIDNESGEKAYSAPMALWNHQTSDNFAIPDFRTWVTAKREQQTAAGVFGGTTSAARGLFGKADEWLYNHYTASVFKPLALANAGFGQRVAMAELIPAVSRYGFGQVFRGMLTAQAAQRNIKILDDSGEFNRLVSQGINPTVGDAHAAVQESSHIAQAMSSMLGGMSRMLRAPKSDLDLAMNLTLDHDSHLLAHGVARTGHNLGGMSNIAVERASKAQRALVATDSPWDLLGVGNKRYTDQWTLMSQKMSQDPSAQAIAKDLRDNMTSADWDAVTQDKQLPSHIVDAERQRIDGENLTPVQAAHREKEMQSMGRYAVQDPTSFASARVDSVLGNVVGADGTVHADLLDKIAKGIKPDFSYAEGQDAQAMPAVVPGRSDGDAISLTARPLARLVDKGFKKLVDPVINGLSRNQLYFNAVKPHYEALTNGADSALARGIIPDATTARMLAEQRATMDILPQIHNTALRSQFSVLASNVMPFYFAQEQAYKRMYQAISYNPALVREYQLINAGLTNSAFIHKDDQGNRSAVIPGVGELGEGAMKGLSALGLPFVGGLPLTFTGDVSSLKTVLPSFGLPSMSPVVSVGAGALGHFFPETQPAIRDLLGSRAFSQPLLNEVMPNVAIRETYRATLGAHSDDSEVYSQMAQALAAVAYHGQLPPEDATPAQQQAFIDRIKNNARSAIFMKGIVSLFSPLSNRPIEEDFGLRDEFYKLLKTNGGDYQKSMLAFQKEHGTRAISYTVAKSKSASGARIPTSQAAIDFINQHQGLLSDYSQAAPFLVPQETKGGDDQVLHQELLTMGLRSQFTPGELLNQFYIAQGNQQYFSNYTKHLQYLANLTGNTADAKILASGSDAGVDTNALEKAAAGAPGGQAELDGWSEYAKGYGYAHPIWYDDFTSTDRKTAAVNTIQQLLQITKDNRLPHNQQTDGVLNLAGAYMNMLAMVQSTPGDTKRAETARKEVSSQWTSFLAQEVQAQPGLQNVVQQVFSRLPTDTASYRYMVSPSSDSQTVGA